MFSPLEEKPKILEKIGLFTVLFNLIDFGLRIIFYNVINQSDKNNKAILTFLTTQDFSVKLNMLEETLGKDLYSRIERINEVRNTLTHGIYGKDGSGDISATKIARRTGNYISIKELTEEKLDSYIKEEREILTSLYKQTVEKTAKKLS